MLKRLDSQRVKRRFLVYDLEWIPGSYPLQVRVVGCYDGARFRCYRTIDDFLANEMTSENRGKWFFAHAGGLADVQFVFDRFLSPDSPWFQKFQVRGSFSGSSVIMAHVRKPNGRNTWHFADSYWLLRDSLRNIGKSLGVEKGAAHLEGATQAEIKAWYATVDEKKLITYCRRDCEVLWHAIDRLQTELIGLGSQLQMTIASNAMQLFRRKYLTRDLTISQAVNDIARESYFASRVEVYQTFCDKGFYYDVNSSFPYSMTQPVPGALLGSGTTIPDNPESMYIADVTFRIPESYLPPLPTRLAGKLFFPFGKWRSWLTGIDIQLMIESGGTLERVHECMMFDRMTDLRYYVEEIYGRRQKETDPFRRLVYKYLLNSLYGKFGERRTKDSLHIFPSAATLDRLSAENMLMPGVFVESTETPVAHEHVAIAAYITARSRKLIYDYMSQSGDFYYCDTDGFATTDNYPTDGKRLGALKLEKEIRQAHFAGPKLYRIDGTVNGKDSTLVKAKGFSIRDGAEASAQWESLIDGDDLEIDRMARIRENFRRGVTHPWETKVKKALARDSLTKRFHYPDGHTRPWHISEIEHS